MGLQDCLGPDRQVLQLQPLYGHLQALPHREAFADAAARPWDAQRGGRVLRLLPAQGSTLTFIDEMILDFLFGTTTF